MTPPSSPMHTHAGTTVMAGDDGSYLLTLANHLTCRYGRTNWFIHRVQMFTRRNERRGAMVDNHKWPVHDSLSKPDGARAGSTDNFPNMASQIYAAMSL